MNWWCTIMYLRLINMMQVISGTPRDTIINECTKLKVQEHLDLNEIMGKWYVVEVIEHTNSIKQQNSEESGLVTKSKVIIDTCPIIKISSIKSSFIQKDPSHISLMWKEDAGTLEYTFWISKNRGPSVWNSDIFQNGTLADKPSYKQFVGTVHLMKAVASHIVITFCTYKDDGQKFSILIGREHKLPKIDIRGIHKLLQRRRLQLLSIKESCTNNSIARSHKIKNFILSDFSLIIIWFLLIFFND